MQFHPFTTQIVTVFGFEEKITIFQHGNCPQKQLLWLLHENVSFHQSLAELKMLHPGASIMTRFCSRWDGNWHNLYYKCFKNFSSKQKAHDQQNFLKIQSPADVTCNLVSFSGTNMSCLFFLFTVLSGILSKQAERPKSRERRSKVDRLDGQWAWWLIGLMVRLDCW